MRLFGTINLLQLQESQYSIDCGMKPVSKNTKDLITEDGNLMTLNVFFSISVALEHTLQYLELLNPFPRAGKRT